MANDIQALREDDLLEAPVLMDDEEEMDGGDDGDDDGDDEDDSEEPDTL